jgi:hypothetical protein
MNTPREKYWLPAKRFGWGWRFPTCWQGWLVFAAYFGLFVLGVTFLHGKAPRNAMRRSGGYLVAARYRLGISFVIGPLFLAGGIAAAFMIPAPAWFYSSIY